MRVWQSVKAIGDIDRAGTPETGGQAGVIVGVDDLPGGIVAVRWDSDEKTEDVDVKNLQALA